MGKKQRGFNQPFSGLRARPRPEPPLKQEPTVAPKPEVVETAPDDDALFAAAVADVQPLNQRARRAPTAPKPKPRSHGRNGDAEALAELEALVSGESAFEVHDAEEFLSGVAPGVNRRLLGELRRGEHSYRRHLDLHGHSQSEAREAVARFITTSRRNGERCVLVVTGRGRKSPGGVSVLRESLPRWLSRHPNRPHVLAFCTARPVDGGPGAFYVLLRRPGVRPFGS